MNGFITSPVDVEQVECLESKSRWVTKAREWKKKKKVVIFNNSNSNLLYHHCHSLKRSFQNGKDRCLDKRVIWDQILPEKVVYHKGVRKGCEYLHTLILYIVIHCCNINNTSAIHNYSKESLPLIISYIEVILWWTSLHKQEENITE